MLMVFVDNGIKFSPEHSSLEIVLKDKLLTVTDHGCGVAAEALPHVFDRFYKTRNEQNKTGTGLGLAIASSLLLHFYFIKNKSVGHWLKHFFEPFPVFVLMNLLEEIARPVTLAMRLFGNILAGEILLEILYFLCPWFVPMIWIAFSLFVGAVQAYIFTTLASVYMKESL